MNVKELIGKYEYLNHNYFRRVDTSEILKDLKQLDEPQKVKVSEEEAKFLETFDFDRDSDITKALYYVSRAGWGHQITDNNNVEMKDLTEDVVFFVKNRKRLIKAILFGYEVEEEKRYLVTIKGDIKENMLVYGELLERYFFTRSFSLDNAIYSHTRKELEANGFGWVFDCEGIEIEEVIE